MLMKVHSHFFRITFLVIKMKAKVIEDRRDKSKFSLIEFPNCSYDVMTSVVCKNARLF